jgi:uncharacterized membrane protein YoaK (UPF0700 family)
MKLRTLFIINAVVCFVFGLGFTLFPEQVISLYGNDAVTGQFKFVGQLFGSALLTFGVISWLAKDSTESNARNAIVFSFFLGDVVGFIIALINQLSGVVNALNWSTVAIYLLLALGFGYFQFIKPGD